MIDITKEFESPTLLYEPYHIYLDKQTSTFYNSVTGVLHLFEPKFESIEVAKRVQKYHNGFIKWYFSLTDNKSAFFSLYDLFIRYRKYREYEIKEWEGRPYKKYKKIEDYVSIEEMENELLWLKEIHDVPKKGANRYVDSDFKVLSLEKILLFWDDLNNIANIYGSLVHTIIEYYVLKKQQLYKDRQKKTYKIIYDLYLLLSETYDLMLIKHNDPLPFVSYKIDSFKDFLHHIIEEYEKLPISWGQLAVPEKILGYKTLRGMTDKYILLDNNTFNIGDHKTNKEFNEYSEYFQKMKTPFHDYDHCELNTYTLQLNMYANMSESVTGRQCNELWIDYYDRETNKFVLKNLERKKEEAAYIINYYFEWIDKLKAKYLKSNLAPFIEKHIKKEWLDFYIKKLNEDVKEKQFGYFKNKKEGLEYYIKFTKNFEEKHKYITYERIIAQNI